MTISALDSTRLSEGFAIEKGDVVAIVGAGGKTTLLYRLTQELAEQGLKVLATTCTKFSYPQADQVDSIVQQPDTSLIIDDLQAAFKQHNSVALVTDVKRQDKVVGASPEIIADIVKADCCDVIVLEADGARKRLIKAHKEFEPVVPAETSLVIAIIPIDVMGQVLSEDIAHRLEQIESLTGYTSGQEVDSALIKQLLNADEGYGRANPPHARYSVLLNRFDKGGAVHLATVLEDLTPGPQTRYSVMLAGSALDRGATVLAIEGSPDA